MRKSIIFGIFLFAKCLFSQQDPATSSPSGISNTASPNAAGFMRFQESSINHYNGRGDFSVPIYEINVGGIKYPISLNYSQGGIQVNSIASDVGLGWSLTSTFINRTVVGDADLETIVDTNGVVNKNKYGYFDYKINELILNHYGGNLNVDFYPDLFKFVSPSNSSRFYFINKTQAIELDQKGTKINWSIENNNDNKYIKDSNDNWVNNSLAIADYKDFNLTTKNGLSYSFENKDITHSFIKSSENEYGFGNITGTYPRVSSWYVSKIKNMNNNEEINFTYESFYSEQYKINDIINEHPYYRYESKFPSANVDGAENNIYFKPNSLSNAYDGDYGQYYNRLLQSQRIKKIKFRGGSVEFNYSNLTREDLKNGKALTGIVVKDENGITVKEFTLEYGYFYSTLVKNEFSKRLKLLSVQEAGQNKYEFQYYEDHKLPNIGSPLQDFFGYNNADETNVETPTYIFSKYYYYPNKNEYSILPYNITNNTNHYILINDRFLNEQIDKEPNELSKTWSLKSVKFPTGGTNTYVLESNTFNLWGNNLKGGGTRIQQQVIEEQTRGQQRIIKYNYNNGNVSSGYLSNVPQAGYPGSLLFPKSDLTPNLNNYGLSLIDYFFLYNNAKINYDVLNNFFIGYSKVEQNEDGIKTVYEFTNEEKPNSLTRSFSQDFNLTIFTLHPMGEFLISNSSYGNNIYIDNSYKRGKLKYITYYEKNKTNPVMIKENVYKGYIGYSGEELDYGYVIPGTSVYSDPIPTISDHEPYDVYHDPYELMQLRKSYNTIYNNLAYTKTTKYLPSGNIEEISNMNYDVYQNLTEVSHKTGNGTTFPIIDLKKYLYPYNLVNPWSQAFEEINKYDTPILIKSYSGEVNPANISNPGSQYLTSQSEIKFTKDTDTSSILMPTQALASIGQGALYEFGKFDRYDSKGNLLQSTKDGLSTTYLYGYKQLYPIAKIEGATYQQVLQALNIPFVNNDSYLNLDIVKKSDLDKDPGTENDLITFLDAFRKHANLANFRVTTYTYNPLVGVTSVTPPSGMREVYIYEAVTNKLKEVKRMEKDAGGTDVYRTLKEYEYHYKPQN